MYKIILSYYFRRQGDYKLIKGFPGLYSGWYPPDKEYQLEEDLKFEKEHKKLGKLGLITSRLYNIKGKTLLIE